MTDFEAYFRLDKELEEAPLLEPEQKVLVRRWLHRFVELKESAAEAELLVIGGAKM